MNPLDQLMRQSVKVGSLRAATMSAAGDLRYLIASCGRDIPPAIRTELEALAERLRNADADAEAHADELYPNKEAA